MYNSKGVSSQLNVSAIDIICLDLDLTILCFFPDYFYEYRTPWFKFVSLTSSNSSCAKQNSNQIHCWKKT